MKKLLFVLACIMFITCVKAELLTPDDVRNGFLNSPLIKFANEDNPDDEKIDAGQTVAIIGSTGSGKTTIIDLFIYRTITYFKII